MISFTFRNIISFNSSGWDTEGTRCMPTKWYPLSRTNSKFPFQFLIATNLSQLLKLNFSCGYQNFDLYAYYQCLHETGVGLVFKLFDIWISNICFCLKALLLIILLFFPPIIPFPLFFFFLHLILHLLFLHLFFSRLIPFPFLPSSRNENPFYFYPTPESGQPDTWTLGIFLGSSVGPIYYKFELFKINTLSFMGLGQISIGDALPVRLIRYVTWWILPCAHSLLECTGWKLWLLGKFLRHSQCYIFWLLCCILYDM